MSCEDKINKIIELLQSPDLDDYERCMNNNNNKDFDELLYLLDKYKDKITIKVYHYIQGNIYSGIIGHRSDYPDYEDIEEVGKDKDGNIELSICVID